VSSSKIKRVSTIYIGAITGYLEILKENPAIDTFVYRDPILVPTYFLTLGNKLVYPKIGSIRLLSYFLSRDISISYTAIT